MCFVCRDLIVLNPRAQRTGRQTVRPRVCARAKKLEVELGSHGRAGSPKNRSDLFASNPAEAEFSPQFRRTLEGGSSEKGKGKVVRGHASTPRRATVGSTGDGDVDVHNALVQVVFQWFLSARPARRVAQSR